MNKKNRIAEIFKELMASDSASEPPPNGIKQVVSQDTSFGKVIDITTVGKDNPTSKQVCHICKKEFDCPVVVLQEAASSCPDGFNMGLCCNKCSREVQDGKRTWHQSPCGPDGKCGLNQASSIMNQVEALVAIVVPTILANRPLNDREIAERSQKFSEMFDVVMAPIYNDETLDDYERFRRMFRAYFEQALAILDDPPEGWTE
jgi:hypothetical protein